jgi:predicted ATP-dependent endonuclease of OLD family
VGTGRIRLLSIRNYRSIAKAQIRLGNLTIFVGPKGAVKGHVLDARNVIVVQAGRLDWDCIHACCNKLGTRERLEEVRRSIPPLQTAETRIDRRRAPSYIHAGCVRWPRISRC